MSFQQMVILGNLGRDPEMRFTKSGDAICNFSVAVSEKYKEQERTTWFRCVAFGKIAEVAQEYLSKGSQCLVQGRMQEDKYTDKAGVEKTSWTLRCDNLRLVGGRGEPRQYEQQPERQKPKPVQGSGFDDFEEVPF